MPQTDEHHLLDAGKTELLCLCPAGHTKCTLKPVLRTHKDQTNRFLIPAQERFGVGGELPDHRENRIGGNHRWCTWCEVWWWGWGDGLKEADERENAPNQRDKRTSNRHDALRAGEWPGLLWEPDMLSHRHQHQPEDPCDPARHDITRIVNA